MFQSRITKSLELTPSRFEGRLEYCNCHLKHFLELRPNKSSGFSALELGTGWYPVVPIGLYLCGAGEIWTYDISPLLTLPRLDLMLQKFLDYARSGKLEVFLPKLKKERLQQLAVIHSEMPKAELGLGPEKAAQQKLERFGIRVRVTDAQHTGLPAGSIDLFTSTGVLEYIPPPVLQGILMEFNRVGVADAVHTHYVNLVDQFSYFDHSITPYNFLRYSARAWRYLNSPLTWQNRMRICDFRKTFEANELQVVKEVNTSGCMSDLERVPLAAEFQDYRKEDLLVLYSWLVAERTR